LVHGFIIVSLHTCTNTLASGHTHTHTHYTNKLSANCKKKCCKAFRICEPIWNGKCEETFFIAETLLDLVFLARVKLKIIWKDQTERGQSVYFEKHQA